MSNQGLKPLSRNLALSCGLGTFECNLCKANQNFILAIPLLSTPDGMKLPISYIYNHLNRNEASTYGNGGFLSLYANFTYMGSSIQQTRFDGATYTYSIGGTNFLSNEDSNYVSYSSGTYTLHSNGYTMNIMGIAIIYIIR